MNPHLPAVAAVSVALVLAGCGKSTGTPAVKVAPVLTAEKAKLVAAATVLTDTDLPGYTSKKQTHDATDQANEKKLAACLGEAGTDKLARDFGTAFTKGAVEVDSSGDVALSVAAAKADLALVGGEKGAGCYKQILTEVLASGGTTPSSLTVVPVALSVPGADGVFGFQIDLTAASGGQKVTIKGFDLGALVGQAEVSLSVLANGVEPLPLADAVALLAKAVGRAKTAAL